MSNLVPRPLLIFQAVYDHQNFSAAAKSIGLSQPAVTKSIQNLEAQLDVKLFERGSTEFKPTRAAEILKRRVRWILREIELINDELKHRNRIFDGHLAIAANPVWANLFLPRILPKVHQQFPDLSLDIAVGSGESLVPLMNEGHLDMCFGVIPEGYGSPHVIHHSLFDVKITIYDRNEHPIHRLDTVEMARVWKYPWVAFSKHLELDQRMLALSIIHELPHKRFSITSMSIASMTSIANQTDHIVFAVDQLEGHMAQNGFRTIQMDIPLLTFRTGAMVRSSIEELEPVKMILDEIKYLQ